MCEITIDNFEFKFEEITYNLKKANYVGNAKFIIVFELLCFFLTFLFK